MAEKSKILIIGGTGYIGKSIVEASAKSGHPTFALVRESTISDPVRGKLIESFKSSGVTLLHGNLYDQDSLVKAIKQVDVVISAVGSMQMAHQVKIIAAIKEAGNIKRFFLSEFVNDVDRTNAVEPAKSIFGIKAQIRRAAEAEGIPFTIVSSNYFAGYFLPTLAQFGLTAPPRDKVTIPGDGNPQALFNANGEEIVPESDLKYAEELQVQEALLASLLSFRMADNPVSHAVRTSPMLIGELSQSFCDICFEEKESWQMFQNKTCSHSFCYDCTSKHIVAKIQDNIKKILCPGVDCKAQLDFNACRTIIPNDALVQWDEALCKSLIPESQKVYCPFRDCLTMLVNDSGEVIKEIECPACHRSICARCRVPWHLEFTCDEFQRLNTMKKGKDDCLVKELAKKKSWRKCPHCELYVEKTEGCLHITCRCGYEFCYKCGSKWTKVHGGCSLGP